MEKRQNNFIWPAVAIICALIVATGVYMGLRDSQPQPTTQTYVGTSSSNYATSTDSVSTDADKSDPIVYATRTGECYHRSHCGYLRKSKIPMKLSEARKRYRPCSKCGPPR